MQVAGCDTAKEIWDSLKSRFIGTEDIQQAHSQQLKSEFERLLMKEDESINSFAGKMMSIITKAATYGLTFDEQTKVRKVLNAVRDKFLPIVATIEMIVDFKTVKLEEIIGKLKTYEERIKFRKGNQEDNSEKLLFTRLGNDRKDERNDGKLGLPLRVTVDQIVGLETTLQTARIIPTLHIFTGIFKTLNSTF
ncbi:hypothetical protein Tco_0989656 [Tanacetum coccineum]|uniref:Zinc finger, CCHC-type n=1 Tax=Tanacetum coccineum TaxID=301880 RepID=A0ABQ5EUM8_9ASTR